MSPEESFHDLVRRLRAGDEGAAAQLVSQYEHEIRRAVRLHMTDPRLRRVLDPEDVCQSVLCNFFVRATAGQFDLEQPEQLLHLLLTMARNRVLDKARQQQANRRDQRRVQADGAQALAGVPDRVETPSAIVSARELLERARGLLSEEERYLADQRAQGRDWADIAAELRSSPEALRKQLARAMDRVAQQLGLGK